MSMKKLGLGITRKTHQNKRLTDSHGDANEVHCPFGIKYKIKKSRVDRQTTTGHHQQKELHWHTFPVNLIVSANKKETHTHTK